MKNPPLVEFFISIWINLLDQSWEIQPIKWGHALKKILILQIGARVERVGEPLEPSQFDLAPLQSATTLIFEFDEVPEPKILNPIELKELTKKYGGYQKAADAIGASEAFVRQTINSTKRKRGRKSQR